MGWTGPRFEWDGRMETLLERLGAELREHNSEYEYATHPSVFVALARAQAEQSWKEREVSEIESETG